MRVPDRASVVEFAVNAVPAWLPWLRHTWLWLILLIRGCNHRELLPLLLLRWAWASLAVRLLFLDLLLFVHGELLLSLDLLLFVHRCEEALCAAKKHCVLRRSTVCKLRPKGYQNHTNTSHTHHITPHTHILAPMLMCMLYPGLLLLLHMLLLRDLAACASAAAAAANALALAAFASLTLRPSPRWYQTPKLHTHYRPTSHMSLNIHHTLPPPA